MTARILTVTDLTGMLQEYSVAFKLAKSEEQLPSPPDFTGCALNPHGLLDSLCENGHIKDLIWLQEYFKECEYGEFGRYACVKFIIPIHFQHHSRKRSKRTLRVNHKELGDIHIDIGYNDSYIELEFVGLI